MITVTFQKDQKAALGLKTEKGILDVEAAVSRFPEMTGVPLSVSDVIAREEEGKQALMVLLDKAYGEDSLFLQEEQLVFGPCVPHPQKIMKRLRTDHIDLYQVHRFVPETPLEETLRALDDLVHQGKVRYVGCSNYAAWQIAKAHGISALHHLHRFESVQPEYSIISREIERELLPFAAFEEVGVIVYSPLGRGLLTGKYRFGEASPQGSRGAAGEQRLHVLLEKERHFRIVEALRPLAERRGWTLPQLALAWVLCNPVVTSAILGASHPAQQRESLQHADERLTVQELWEIDNITQQAGSQVLV